MNKLIKLTVNEDGEEVKDSPWHLVDPSPGDASDRVFCSGECFGEGEGAARGTTKTVIQGGITCGPCLDKLKEYKKVRI